MAAYLTPLWENYLKHGDVQSLRDDIITYPWYEAPKVADESLLMRAVEWGDFDATKMLLEMGENPQLPADSGFSFLHVAVDQAKEMLDQESDVSTPERKAALSILNALLECGANPNVQGADGTPLHRAAGWGDVDSARILVSFGADIEARMRVDGELTPLMHAALSGQPKMVQFLVDAGANRNAMSRMSLILPPMTLRALLDEYRVPHLDEILAILNK